MKILQKFNNIVLGNYEAGEVLKDLANLVLHPQDMRIVWVLSLQWEPTACHLACLRRLYIIVQV